MARPEGGLGKDLQSLQEALAVGNISGAQHGFTPCKKDLPTVGVKKNGVEASTRNNADTTTKADPAGLQNALSAGDIPGAQDAFKLKQDLRKTARDAEETACVKDTNNAGGDLAADSQLSQQVASAIQGNSSRLDLYA